MKTFSVRAVNLVLIVALLIGYNTVLTLRDKDDQIAKLTADLESANLYKQSVMQSQEDAAGGSYEDGIWKGEAQGFGGWLFLAGLMVAVSFGRAISKKQGHQSNP